MSTTSSNIHPKLSKCNICSKERSVVDIEVIKHGNYHGCDIVKCNNCHSAWYICSLHHKRFSMSNQSKMVKHFTSLHAKALMENSKSVYSKKTIDDTNEQDQGIAADDDMFFRSIEDSDHTPVPSPPLSPNMYCTLTGTNHPQTKDQMELIQDQFKDTRANFFVDEMANYGNGICGITANAFAQSFHTSSKSSLHEASFHLQATHFCSQLTQNQQKQFASLMNDIMTKKFDTTKIPMSIADIRKFYTNGKYSIYQNLPRPKTFQMDNHACISLLDILNHSLAMGIELDLFRSSYYKQMVVHNNDLHHIKRSRDIFKEVYDTNKDNDCDPYVFLLIIWSDDFEVNHTRKNRNSTWLKTVTLLPPPNMTTSKKHTSVICLGRKNQDHSTVNKFFQDELTTLLIPKERYVYQLQQFVPTVARVLTMSSDRPERCALNNVLNYSGLSTRRWLYSSLVDPFKLASCHRCILKRFNSMFVTKNKRKRPNSCGYCCDFDYDTLKDTNTFKIPEKYPKKSHPSSPYPPKGREIEQVWIEKKMRPMKLNYDVLTKGLEFGVFNYHRKYWSKSEASEYLRLLGIGSQTTKYALDYASAYPSQAETAETLFQNFKYPSLWKSGLSLDIFVETPMHHLFEGIVKSIIEIQMEFFKLHNKWSTFGSISNNILADISHLKISYCRAEQFTSGNEFKTGGWIAETYLGYSRLMIILINQTDKILTTPLRGYNELVVLVQVLYALICRLMQHNSNNLDQIDDYIKLFLSVCHVYETKIGFDDNSYPFWYRKSNFVSLLNLPAQIEEYGPVYLHWEGVRERFIQHVKPSLTNMRTTASYLCTKIEKIHQDNTLEMLYENHTEMKSTTLSRFDNFETFDNCEEVQDRIKNNLSFSGVVVKLATTTYGVVIKEKKTYDFYEIIFKDDIGFHRCKLWYSQICLRNTNLFTFANQEEVIEKAMDYILFIPLYSAVNDEHMEYTIISKNWKCRLADNTLSTFTPSIPSLKNMIESI